jgi:hypothetical protein
VKRNEKQQRGTGQTKGNKKEQKISERNKEE